MRCSTCRIDKEEDSFSWKKKGVRRNTMCKECHKKYRHQHYLRNRDQVIRRSQKWRESVKIEFYEWLRKQSCSDCGVSDFRVLEFDHLSDKKFDISRKIGMVSFQALMIEIEKCDVVCANCHRIRTSDRGNHYRYLDQANSCE